MSIRTKTLIILLVTFLPLLIIFYFTTRLFITANHAQLEERMIEKGLYRVVNALDMEAENLNQLAYDWAAWDDTYAFITNTSQAYIDSNLTEESFHGLKISFMAFIDTQGVIKFSRAYNVTTEEFETVPKDLKRLCSATSDWLRHSNLTSSIYGLVPLSRGPFMFSSRPIITSKDEGPVQGVLVMGRYISGSQVADIAHITDVPFELYMLTDQTSPVDVKRVALPLSQAAQSPRAPYIPVSIQAVSKRSMTGYALMRDYNKKPAFIIKTAISRDIHHSGVLTLNYMMLCIIGLSGFFCLVIASLLERNVIKPLLGLNREIRQVALFKDLSKRIVESGNNEISEISRQINEMLNQLEITTLEKLETEERYSSFVRHFQGVALRMDASRNMVFIHGAVEEITGYTAKSFVDGDIGLLELVHTDDKEEFQLCVEQLACISDYSCDIEFRIIDQEGDIRWVHGLFQTLSDSEDEPTHIQGALYDITRSKEAEIKLEQSREQLQKLAAYLQSIREAESTRIARRIHDELGQLLMALKIDIAWLGKRMVQAPDELLKKTESMKELVTTIAETVQTISLELRPSVLDKLDFTDAIEWLSKDFEKRTEIICTLSVVPDGLTLDKELATTVFRILQECLSNVGRHSKASRTTIIVEKKPYALWVCVQDNGVGIPAEKIDSFYSFGLMQIRERAEHWGGEVFFKSEPGEGTIVRVTIPDAFLNSE